MPSFKFLYALIFAFIPFISQAGDLQQNLQQNPQPDLQRDYNQAASAWESKVHSIDSADRMKTINQVIILSAKEAGRSDVVQVLSKPTKNPNELFEAYARLANGGLCQITNGYITHPQGSGESISVTVSCLVKNTRTKLGCLKNKRQSIHCSPLL